MITASSGDVKMIKLLLREGAQFDIRDRGGNLAMHDAAKNGHVNALVCPDDANPCVACLHRNISAIIYICLEPCRVGHTMRLFSTEAAS